MSGRFVRGLYYDPYDINVTRITTQKKVRPQRRYSGGTCQVPGIYRQATKRLDVRRNRMGWHHHGQPPEIMTSSRLTPLVVDVISSHGPGRAGPKKAHDRKLRPRLSQALPSGLLFKPKPGPSGKKPLGLRAVGRTSSLKCQYAKPKPVQALLVGSKLRPKPSPRASPSGLGPGF